jgi:hypothetical protein
LHDNTADGVSVERGGSGGTLRVKAEGISLAHLADGTAKTVLGYDQNGAAAVIPAGAAGTILTANASTAPTFQTNPGALKLLAYSQAVLTSHTPLAATAGSPIAQIIIPENHGFEDVMIEVDSKGSTSTGAAADNNRWSLTVSGSEVKQWRMARIVNTAGSAAESDFIDCASVETFTYVGDAPTGNDAARTVVFRKHTSDASAGTITYDVEFYSFRIWGLNLGSLTATPSVAP